MRFLLFLVSCSLFLNIPNVLALPLIEDDGGISSGGGGDTLKSPLVSEKKIKEILKDARRDLYMLFARESWQSSFPWPELFEGKDHIFQLLRFHSIYASPNPCEDATHESKDGSSHSPFPDKICISLSNLATKLHEDNARVQTLALVAHEYAHLKQFDETKAHALQSWLVAKLQNSSSPQAWTLLYTNTSRLMDIRDVLAGYYNKKAEEFTWDNLCFLMTKLQSHMASIQKENSSAPYSIFNKILYKKHNTEFLRAELLMSQSCAKSSFHPSKIYFEKYVYAWFGKKKYALSQEVVGDRMINSDYREIIENIVFSKVDTLQDFSLELGKINFYILDEFSLHNNILWTLDSYFQANSMPIRNHVFKVVP